MADVPIEDVQRAVQALVDGTAEARGPVAESVARRKVTRAARLTAAAARLEEELGSEAPEVVELKASIDLEEQGRVILTRRGERERRRPTPKSYEWMAYGRVLNHDGTPAVGARVRLFDKDRKYDDLLGETKVDEFGDWAIGPYHARDFFEHGENAPELYVKVYGYRNKLVFNGEETARFDAGRVEYFEITLADPEAPAPKRPGKESGKEGPAPKQPRKQPGKT